MIKVSSATPSVSSFTWSTSEQVWPFEKASDGSTLYCLQSAPIVLPNNGYSTWAHGILNLSGAKVHRFEDSIYVSAGGGSVMRLSDMNNGSNTMYCFVDGDNFGFRIYQENFSGYTGIIKLIYAK